MNTLIIRNGLLLSKEDGYHFDQKDILIEDGRIKEIADHIESDAEEVNALGQIVSPGFIDLHVHCYPATALGLTPDLIGIQKGVTTIIDAGSSGADTYEDFREHVIKAAKTKVYTLLNVSSTGLSQPHELSDLHKIKEEDIKKIITAYSDNIIGFKARASASVVMEMGITPIKMAAEIAHRCQLPLMVHIGNYPPSFQEVLAVLGDGDIVTHAYHGKEGGILEHGAIIPEALDAKARGVAFDIGHGSASFSFPVYRQARSQLASDFISSDLHVENIHGPVYSLPATMTKLLNCQEDLADIVHKVTYAAAKHFHLEGLGVLRQGAIADLSIFHIADCDKLVEDSQGNQLQEMKEIRMDMVISSREDQSEIYQCNAE